MAGLEADIEALSGFPGGVIRARGAVGRVEIVHAHHRIERNAWPQIITAGELDDIQIVVIGAGAVLVTAMRLGEAHGPKVPIVGRADAVEQEVGPGTVGRVIALIGHRAAQREPRIGQV
jgi:hypothetical protein